MPETEIECGSCRRKAEVAPHMFRGYCPHCGCQYTSAAMRAVNAPKETP